jgi:hypothetical protein
MQVMKGVVQVTMIALKLGLKLMMNKMMKMINPVFVMVPYLGNLVKGIQSLTLIFWMRTGYIQ